MKIVIGGAGSVGTYLVERLVVEQHDIVVVDNDESVLQKLSSHFDIQTTLGSVSSLKSQAEAGVDSADIFVAATNSDETNLIACLLADSLNQDMRKIARVRELVTDESGLSSRIATVFDQFINPDWETASAFLRLFDYPGASEIMEFGRGSHWVIGAHPEANSEIIGVKLKDLRAFQKRETLVVALVRDGQFMIPGGEDSIEKGDEVFVSTVPRDAKAFLESVGKPVQPVANVMIFGGSNVARHLAVGLRERETKVKLIEPCAIRCKEFAEDLSRVLVLQGEGTDQELLREEGVADVDFFVGASEDQEKNVLAAMLAKRLGARQTAIVITNRSYLDIVSELGIDIAISPQISAASRILKFVRSSSISSVFSTRDDRAEVLEIGIVEGNELVGVPIQDMKLPTGVIIAAVFRDSAVEIPRGETLLEIGDRVVFFAERKSLPKLQSLVDPQKSVLN